ncbi:1-acyl-sn-glycerol-3-phosphate acyltransferase [Colwelliaceae bacterium 6471]
MKLPVVHDCIPRTEGKLGYWLGSTTLKILGWKITGEFPPRKKFICAVAPHTSNWDFVIGVAVMLALRLKIKFLGKNAIFVWPFAGLLKKLGGIPVDRSHRHGVVGQMVKQFNENEYMIFALAPEGTRSKTAEWKTGFLHIAHQAKVPIVPVSFHFDKKEVHIQQETFIGDDIAGELARVKACFDSACAKNPQAV